MMLWLLGMPLAIMHCDDEGGAFSERYWVPIAIFWPVVVIWMIAYCAYRELVDAMRSF